jgi:hypothetical protein
MSEVVKRTGEAQAHRAGHAGERPATYTADASLAFLACPQCRSPLVEHTLLISRPEVAE